MPSPREIELKLELDSPPSSRAGRPHAILARFASGSPEGETRRLVSAIYDTLDHALRRRGFVLRVRRVGDRRIQTLKADMAGPFERAEWECDIEGDSPDLAAIPDEAVRREVEAAGPLVPVLATEFDRTLWRVRRDGSDLELSFDEGAIRAGGLEAPIGEIEIELKSGAPTAIFGLARDIVAAAPARLGLRSKSERGYGLLREAGASGKGSAQKEAAPEIDRTSRVGTAFQILARGCLRQYHLHEPGILGREANELHKARVAIRRLRTCLKLHRDLVADEEGERLKRGLRTFSGLLGTARNLDVLLERLEGGSPEADALRTRVSADREAAYDKLASALRSKRIRLLFLDLMAFVETGSWLRDPERRKLRETKARTFARKLLDKRWRRLRKSGRDLAEQSAEARHEVRIEGKVLRYASEFFAGAFPGKKRAKRRAALLDALTEMQTHLGDLNDIETGAVVVGGGDAPATDHAKETELVASAQAAHKRLRKAEPFWT